MNYTAESICEINKIEKITLSKMKCDPRRWLDIAFKLDYITLKEKETIFALLQKFYSNKTNVAFCKTNYNALKRMGEIVSNTVLPSEAVEAITE